MKKDIMGKILLSIFILFMKYKYHFIIIFHNSIKIFYFRNKVFFLVINAIL